MFYVIKDLASDGHANMQRDVELFESAEKFDAAFCRFYTWDGIWVSLGKFQNPNADLKQPSNTQFVMRPTGGKAVLHGHDLTVSIAVPLKLLGENSRNVKSIYRSIIKPIVKGFTSCGIQADLAENTVFAKTKSNVSDCFKHISVNDVVNVKTGRKLVGCALKVTKTSALAQCSIPISLPQIDPAAIFHQSHVPQPLELDQEGLVQQITKSFVNLFSASKKEAALPF